MNMMIPSGMRKMILCLSVAVLSLICCDAYALSISDANVRNVLHRLDREIGRRHLYIDAHQARIDSFGLCYGKGTSDLGRKLDVAMKLADEYTAFNADSALSYYSRGYDMACGLGNDSAAMAFRLKRATYLPLAGFIKDAVDEYCKIGEGNVPESLKELYYDCGRQMYSYIASFYKNYPEVNDYWNKLAMAAQSELIALLDESSPKYKLNMGEYHYAHGDYSKAEVILVDLLESLPEESNMFARASHIVANIAKNKGNRNKYIYFLTLSAIADVKSATLEVVSLQELGESLFLVNDINRAYNYISVALTNAAECHATMRMIQTSEALPIIESAHAAELESWRNMVYAVMIGMALLVVGLIVLLLFLHREMKRMSVLQQTLKQANDVKELYMSQFLNLCSIYMDKLNQFSKIVNRKITAGKVDDLYKLTKSGKYVEESGKEFYNVFDNAFLHIYPTFVEDVNRLLRKDEQITLADGEIMNTDLRILAFMRLGIEESTRIAQILNYSVNTIYAYRNKLKNRAVVRDTFEADVMKIGSIT